MVKKIFMKITLKGLDFKILARVLLALQLFYVADLRPFFRLFNDKRFS